MQEETEMQEEVEAEMQEEVTEGFISTQRGEFIDVLRHSLRMSKSVDIATGFISVEGLEEVIEELFYPNCTRILVGAYDNQGINLKDVLEGERISTKPFGNTDTYTALRYLMQQNRLQIAFTNIGQGYRLFHAKGYLFNLKDQLGPYFICGSNNFTCSGLKYNREWAVGTKDLSVNYYAQKSFDLEWKLNTQRVAEVPSATYVGEILEATEGTGGRGQKYIELLYKLSGPKDYIVIVDRIKTLKSAKKETLHGGYCVKDISFLERIASYFEEDTSTYLDGLLMSLEGVKLLVTVENKDGVLRVKGRGVIGIDGTRPGEN